MRRRSRIVHRRRTVEPSPEPRPESNTGAPPSPAHRPKVADQGDLMREVRLENVHPLRLRLLVEIEQTGSISAAAEACAIAQPSASMHLRTLEMAVGQTLVIRNGGGSTLTSAGKVVASHAARVLETLDSMRRALAPLDARNGDELILAASLTPSVALIPPILRQFSDRCQHVGVDLRTIPSEAVIQEVVHGRADIGIAGELPTTEQVVRRRIMVDEIVGIAPVGLLRISDGWVSLGEIARHSLLLGGSGSSTRIVTERYLARAQCRPVRIWRFDCYEAIKRAVADGLGVSFMSQLLARDEVERGELIAFRVSGVERMVRPIHVVRSAVRELTPEGAAFMTLVAGAPWSATSLGSRL
jgi:LysR family transcriptional regulator, low CO2-responsive transcriptional regulator